MAPRPAFNPPFDIHLMRGQSIRLEQLLEIDGTEAADYTDDHPNISYAFRTSFIAHASLKVTATIGNASSRKPTCRVSIGSAAPAAEYLMPNFLVFVVVTDTDDGTTSETAIRIHVHSRIEEIWMSPSTFTVYQGMSSARCSVYARFDDEVIAEIGDIYHGDNEGVVDYGITNKISLKWSSATTGLVSVSGRITPGTRTGSHPVKIEAKYGGRIIRADGEIRISDALTATQTAIVAEKVTGSKSPGAGRLNEVPNILFLPDGFKSSTQFDAIVNDYVKDLTEKKITAPFGTLADSINFWKAFVPSRESGITYRGVLDVIEDIAPDGVTPIVCGYNVTETIKPESDDASTWDVEHLLYYVPWCIKGDDTIPDADLRTRWEHTTRLSAEQLDAIFAGALVYSWSAYMDRRLPDARDSAFGIMVNNYTAYENNGEHELINFDRRKVQREFLDKFLGGLKDKDNNSIGSVFVMDPTTDNRGKDYDNIVFILAGSRGREQNEDGYMFVLLKEDYPMLLTGKLADIRTSEVPLTDTKLTLVTKSTLTHELCHSFGLGDEYGETPDDDSYTNKPVTDPLVSPWKYTKYTSPPRNLDIYSNIQAKSDFERPKPGGGTELDAFRLKWRYHRIQKCTLVTAISSPGTELIATLKNPEVAFGVNSVVFLRKRNVNRQLIRVLDVDDNPIGIVVNSPAFPRYFLGFYELKVRAVDATLNKVTLSNSNGVRQEIEVMSGQVSNFRRGQRVYLTSKRRVTDAIRTTYRIQGGTGQPLQVSYALSPPLKVKAVGGGTVTLEALGQTTPVDNELKTLRADEELLLYEALIPPASGVSPQYPYYEIISKPVLEYLDTHPYPLNVNKALEEIIDKAPVQASGLPKKLIPSCTKREKEIVGIYSGGSLRHGDVYHPTARCMMRTHNLEEKSYIELCAVCRYTLINMINPLKFREFDKDYMKRKIYPK